MDIAIYGYLDVDTMSGQRSRQVSAVTAVPVARTMALPHPSPGESGSVPAGH